MIINFSENQKKTNKYLCLDIGTEFLKVLVFNVLEDEIEILEYLKSRQHVAAMKNGTITSIRRVTENIIQTMSNLENKNFGGVILGIAGELVKGIIVETNYRRQRINQPIALDEINFIVNRLKEDAYEQAKNLVFTQIGDITGEYANVVMLNYSIIEAILDGFSVEDPLGMTGENISIKFYFTFAPMVHVNYFNSIAKAINLNLIGIVSQPFAVARALAKGHGSDFSTIVIDVGGGTTDIALIQNGIPMHTNMLAFGSRVFTKRIAMDLNLSINEAEEFKIKYSNGKLSEYRQIEVRNSIMKDVGLWATQVAIGLEEFLPYVDGFPESFRLCGGGSMLPEIKEQLIEYPWIKELPFNRSPKVKFLYPKDLSNINDPKGLLVSIDDVTPASIARFTLDILHLSNKG